MAGPTVVKNTSEGDNHEAFVQAVGGPGFMAAGRSRWIDLPPHYLLGGPSFFLLNRFVA